MITQAISLIFSLEKLICVFLYSLDHNRIQGSTDKSAVQHEKRQICEQIRNVNKITSVNM